MSKVEKVEVEQKFEFRLAGKHKCRVNGQPVQYKRGALLQLTLKESQHPLFDNKLTRIYSDAVPSDTAIADATVKAVAIVKEAEKKAGAIIIKATEEATSLVKKAKELVKTVTDVDKEALKDEIVESRGKK